MAMEKNISEVLTILFRFLSTDNDSLYPLITKISINSQALSFIYFLPVNQTFYIY